MPKPNETNLNLRVGSTLKKALQTRAKRNRRNLSDYVRIVLEQHVDATKDGK